MTAATFQFGEFELDCERFELRRGPHPIRLERKPLELLILLASSGGRLVTRAEIARCLWPSEVFVDTEHGINTAIRKIRHALREAPDHPRFLQTVTGKGYRFTGATTTPPPSPAQPPQACHPEERSDEGPPYFAGTTTRPGAPGPGSPASSLAGAARLDSETWVSGLPPIPGVPSSPRAGLGPAAAKVGKLWLTLSFTAALALIAFFLFGTHSIHGHTTRPTITSIAVLPLDNLSGDPSQNYLADGMTDELTTMVAKDSTLRVISRTSVMQFKGAHRPLPEIARQLHVDGILEGSIARTGDNLHMTVQLIHAPTDTHLWAESYDRSPEDLVSLPSDAALTIAKETHSSIASPAPQRYVNPAAHDAYLRGRFLRFSGHDAEAGRYFIQATQLQPDYALAWTGLSAYYGAGCIDFQLDPRIALPLDKAAALKAMQLDPSLPEAHHNLGATYWEVDWNLNAALAELSRAIELDPKFTEAWHLRSKILIQLNRYDEGIKAQQHAMELNPFERPWGMAYALLMSRHFDAAITDAKQRLEGNPDPLTWWVLSEAYRGKGMDKEWDQALEKALLLWNNTSDLESVHRAFAQGGRRAVLRWYIDHYKIQAQKGYESPYHFASLYAQLGDKQQALAYLDECLRQHAPSILDIQNDTAFDALHSDPHFRAIVRQIGLTPAWQPQT